MLGYLTLDRPSQVPLTGMLTLDANLQEGLLRDRHGERRLEALLGEGAAWSQAQAFDAAFAVSRSHLRAN